MQHARSYFDCPSHCAEVIDGKQMAADVRKEIAEEVSALKDKIGKVSIVLVSDSFTSLSGTRQVPALAEHNAHVVAAYAGS